MDPSFLLNCKSQINTFDQSKRILKKSSGLLNTIDFNTIHRDDNLLSKRNLQEDYYPDTYHYNHPKLQPQIMHHKQPYHQNYKDQQISDFYSQLENLQKNQLDHKNNIQKFPNETNNSLIKQLINHHKTQDESHTKTDSNSKSSDKNIMDEESHHKKPIKSKIELKSLPSSNKEINSTNDLSNDDLDKWMNDYKEAIKKDQLQNQNEKISNENKKHSNSKINPENEITNIVPPSEQESLEIPDDHSKFNENNNDEPKSKSSSHKNKQDDKTLKNDKKENAIEDKSDVPDREKSLFENQEMIDNDDSEEESEVNNDESEKEKEKEIDMIIHSSKKLHHSSNLKNYEKKDLIKYFEKFSLVNETDLEKSTNQDKYFEVPFWIDNQRYVLASRKWLNSTQKSSSIIATLMIPLLACFLLVIAITALVEDSINSKVNRELNQMMYLENKINQAYQFKMIDGYEYIQVTINSSTLYHNLNSNISRTNQQILSSFHQTPNTKGIDSINLSAITLNLEEDIHINQPMLTNSNQSSKMNLLKRKKNIIKKRKQEALKKQQIKERKTQNIKNEKNVKQHDDQSLNEITVMFDNHGSGMKSTSSKNAENSNCFEESFTRPANNYVALNNLQDTKIQMNSFYDDKKEVKDKTDIYEI